MSAPPAIEIVAYDPAWPARFRAEQARLREALEAAAVRIDHVGSTSVPGLAAKPVIDIQISLRPLHPLAPWVRALETIGYRHVPHPDDATYPFLHHPAEWPHIHHVHLCEAGGSEERRHLAFRDYLRQHPREAEAYAEVKRALAARHHAASFASRNAYSDAKSSFVEPRIARALALGLPRDGGGPR